jgi:hypothetical protein
VKHTDDEIEAGLRSVKDRFVAGTLTLEEARDADRYWRAQKCVNRGYVKPETAGVIAPMPFSEMAALTGKGSS